MKIRSSTKIGVGFAAIVLAGYFSYHYAMERAVANEHFNPPAPGRVNLVGIDTGSGFRVIVANQMAQLVQASGDFKSNESSSEGATEGAIKKRIPIREMLAVLRGDKSAVGPFVMTINEMSENDLPPVAPQWSAEDIQSALDGDKNLVAKLRRDLNIELDGTPLRTLRISSMEQGIVVNIPVPVRIQLDGKPVDVVGRVRVAYKPRLMRATETRYADKANLTKEIQAGTYAEEAAKVFKGSGKEDVRKSLEALIDKKTTRKWAETAERILKGATVVVNDSHISDASSRQYDTTDGKRYDITLHMTDEGRRRLWKYSVNKVGTYLMLISDGIAIEAPKISHELAQGELTITQMRDAVLVRDAVKAINEHQTSRAR